MSDSNTAQARAQRTSRPASEAGTGAETPRTEMPSSLVDLVEKSIARTKDMHEKMSSVLEHSTEAFQEAVSCANRGSAEYRVKLMEIARANANAAFDLAREMFEVKSLPELFERTVNHQRKQLDLVAAQLKDLSALTQKVVNETAEPIRTGLTEPFKIAS
jgi:phasin